MVKDKLISVDRLINGLPIYLKTLKSIFIHPFDFPKELNLNDKKQFIKSIDFITYSIALIFLLLLPIGIIHDQKIGKVFFLIRMLMQFVIVGIIFHYVLWLLGEKKYTIKYTLGIYAYLTGTFLPLSIIISYPIFIRFGPDILFEFKNNETIYLEELKNNFFLLVLMCILYIWLAIFSNRVFLSWISLTHNISKFKVFCSISIAAIVYGSLGIYLLIPLMNKIASIADIIFNAL